MSLSAGVILVLTGTNNDAASTMEICSLVIPSPNCVDPEPECIVVVQKILDEKMHLGTDTD